MQCLDNACLECIGYMLLGLEPDNADVVIRLYMIICMCKDISPIIEKHFSGYFLCLIVVVYAKWTDSFRPTLQGKSKIRTLYLYHPEVGHFMS